MCLVRALALALSLAASLAACIAGPQPEPPTGRQMDGSPGGLPFDDAGPGGGVGADAATAPDGGAAAPDAGASIDGGAAPGPIVIPPKAVDYPRARELGPGPSPSLIDGSQATVDGGVTGP